MSKVTTDLNDVSMDDLLATQESMRAMIELFEATLETVFKEAVVAYRAGKRDDWRGAMLFLSKVVSALEACSTIGASSQRGVAVKLGEPGQEVQA